MITERHGRSQHHGALYIPRAFDFAHRPRCAALLIPPTLEPSAVFETNLAGYRRFGEANGKTKLGLKRTVIPGDDHRLERSLPELLTSLP